MNNLSIRPVDLRLAVAVICDAALGGFEAVHPSSTLERLIEEDKHPYSLMWRKIGAFYLSYSWSDLSDKDLMSQTGTMALNGFLTEDGHFISPGKVKEAAFRWKSYGWYDYEIQRASKFNKASLWGAKVCRLALVGFGFPIIADRIE